MLENVQIVFHKQPKFKTPVAQCTQKNRKKQENSRFSSLFAAGGVSRETSLAAKSEEKRLFSQVNIMMTDFSCFWAVIIANSGSLGPVNGDLLYSFLLYVLHAFRIYAPVSSQGALLLKQGQNFEDLAVHPHQEFPGVRPQAFPRGTGLF